MSAFYLDVLKDRLYTSGAASEDRRSSQTALYEIVTALVRMFAPILTFTSEEVWKSLGSKVGDQSVHLEAWPEVRKEWLDEGLGDRWKTMLGIRNELLSLLETAREAKSIGSSLEAKIVITCENDAGKAFLDEHLEKLPEVILVSQVECADDAAPGGERISVGLPDGGELVFTAAVQKADGEKCSRCWNYRTETGSIQEHPELCARCADVVQSVGEMRGTE